VLGRAQGTAREGLRNFQAEDIAWTALQRGLDAVGAAIRKRDKRLDAFIVHV